MKFKKHYLLFLVLAVSLTRCSEAPDTGNPRTLLFSPISPEYLQNTAADWAQTGFNGFLLSNIMSNWSDDIWSTDGDSASRDANDLTLQRVLACNDACAAHL